MDKTGPSRVFFTWDIHYACNYKCTYCFLAFEPETASIEAAYLRPEQWIGIWTDIYKRYGPSHVLVTGGEPFTYPGFMDLVSAISGMHTLSFSTNLSWDVDEFIKKVDKERVEIESSFHPEFVSIEEFMRKVNLLRDADYFVGVTVVAYPPFLDKIKGYKEIFKKEKIGLNMYPYRGPYESRTYPEAYSESERGALKDLGLEIGIKPNKALMEAYDTTVRTDTVSTSGAAKKLCRMGQRYAKITPDGNAYRCCAAVNKDWGMLGNLATGSFELLKEAKECPDFNHCRCYKSMVIGEEKRWTEYWKIPEEFRKERGRERDLGKAKALRDKGQMQEAINKIKDILDERPDDIRALTLLGEVYLVQKDFTASEKVLQEALKKNTNPDNVSWLFRTLGKLYCESAASFDDRPDEKQKRLHRSVDYLKKAIESTDGSNNLVDKVWAHYEIAVAYSNQKKYPEAREDLKIALKYEPENQYFRRLEDSLR